MDDGTTTRISENHYHMTTTTAQAQMFYLTGITSISMARAKCKCGINN